MFTNLTQSVRRVIGRLFKRPAPRQQSPDVLAHAERQLVYALAPSRFPNIRQLRYLPRVISKNERMLLTLLSAFFIVALLFLGARTFTRNAQQSPRAGGGIVEGLVGSPQYVNPVLAGTNDVDRDLVRLLYSGLMKRTASQEIVPDLASTVDVSTDGKVYTAHLRENLAWSDGKALSADDVLMTFEIIQDPLFKSPLRSQFRNLKVERVDEKTITFTLTQPSSSFLSNLTVGILPAHIWGDVPPPNFALVEYNLKPVGSGPFAFDSLKRDAASGSIKEFMLVRNDHYSGQRPYLDTMTLKIFSDVDSAVEALKAKRIESLSVIPSYFRTTVKQARLADLQIMQYTALFLNGKRPALKTVEVRRALAQAIDRTDIINAILKDSAVVVDGPFASNIPGAAGALQPAYNPDEANKSLDAAGWVRQDNGKPRKKGSDELSFSLTITDLPEDLAIAEKLKQSWEAIGAKIEVKSYDATRIAKEVIKPRDYDAFLYGEILGADGDLYPFWHSTQERDPGLNLTTFYNKDADKLLDELRNTTDANVVKDKRIAFQRLLGEQLPAIFLYSPFYTYSITSRIKGFNISYVTNPSDRFADVDRWFVKTKVSFK